MFYIKNITFNLSRNYYLTINYTPEDDPINGQDNGANPCWVLLNFSNGRLKKIHHTFNVQHPETYNWSVNLSAPFYRNGLIFTAQIYDNGPDNITLYWYFDNNTNITSYYPNPNKIYPVIIRESQSHIFPTNGNFTITLVAMDNYGGKSFLNVIINVQ